MWSLKEGDVQPEGRDPARGRMVNLRGHKMIDLLQKVILSFQIVLNVVSVKC